MYVPNTINAIEQIPSWDTNSRSAGQNNQSPLRNSNVHQGPRKIQLQDPILSYVTLIHILKLYSFKIYFNIILPFTCM
jgi:hypothetical protein